MSSPVCGTGVYKISLAAIRKMVVLCIAVKIKGGGGEEVKDKTLKADKRKLNKAFI